MSQRFKKTKIATYVCMALTSTVSLNALAFEESKGQKSQIEDVEIIQVTGVRSSLTSALNAKRGSDSVSDSIIAEDIGKSSDESIGEALSRVTGVSMNRGGNSQTVTVRGIQPSLNVINLNGVAMTSNTNSQAVDLSLFSADILSRIDVIKSPSASQEEGSLGATIDLKTVAPLSVKDNTNVFSAEARYNDLSEETSPRFSYSFINNISEKVGFAGSFFYDNQNERTDEYNNFNAQIRKYENAIDTDTGEIIPGETWAVQPSFFVNRVLLNDKTKMGGTGTFQYRPSEDTDIRFDTTFSRQEIDHDRSMSRLHNVHRQPHRITIDRNSGASNSVVAAEAARIGGLNQSGTWLNTTDTLIVGAEIEHALNDLWLLSGRIGYSSTSQEYSDNYKVNWTPAFTGTLGDDEKWCGVDFDYGSEGDLLPALDLCSAFNSNVSSTMVMDQLRSDVRELDDNKFSAYFDASRAIDNEFFTTLSFGVKLSDRTKNVLAEEVSIKQRDFGRETPILMSEVDTSDFTDGHFLSGITPAGTVQSWLYPDINQAVNLAFPGGIGPGTANEFVSNPLKNWEVSEKTYGAYVQLDFELLDGDITGNFGVRYVKTEVDSKGSSGIRFDNQLAFLTDGEYVVSAVNDSNEYSNWLPSATINWSIEDDLIVRASAARVLARPSIDSLRPNSDIKAQNMNETPAGSGGNTQLDPFVANQFDLSVEWYFDESALLSGALFYKDFSSYTYDTTIERQINNPLTNTCVIDRSGYVIEEQRAATGPCANVGYSTTVNGGSASIQGLEIAYQQNFDFLPGILKNLGTQINYTYADSEQIVDPKNPSNAFNGLPFLNTSEHSTNATAYWEDESMSFRLVYSYRSDAISKTADRNSTFIKDARGVLDFAANLKVNDDLTLTFSASNLTDTYDTTYNVITNPVAGGVQHEGIVTEFDGDLSSYNKNRIASLFHSGRSYRLSLRYNF